MRAHIYLLSRCICALPRLWHCSIWWFMHFKQNVSKWTYIKELAYLFFHSYILRSFSGKTIKENSSWQCIWMVYCCNCSCIQLTHMQAVGLWRPRPLLLQQQCTEKKRSKNSFFVKSKANFIPLALWLYTSFSNKDFKYLNSIQTVQFNLKCTRYMY